MARCPTCGEIHDLSEIELACDGPAAYMSLSDVEREERCIATDGVVVIDSGAPNARYFRRGVIVFPIIGDSSRDGFGWGVWVEVTAGAFDRMIEIDDSPDRVAERPFPGRLANELPAFPGSFGVRVRLKYKSLDLAPVIEIVDDDNDVGRAQHAGILPEDVLEWVFPIVHPRP